MNQKTKNLVGAGVFTAIVLVLQFLGGTFKIGPLNINVSLVPIVVGAAVYDWKVGAWLGLMSGAAILVAGQAADFLVINPLGTVVTVLAKGTLCGLIAGLVYTALSKKNRWVAIIVAAVVCPVVNTGVFLLGCLLFGFCSGLKVVLGGSSGVNMHLISMIPYVVTVIVLVLFVGKSHVPAANGKPYIKSK